jgi:hypothetical protein
MNTIIVVNLLSKIQRCRLIVIEEKLDNQVKRYEVDTEFDATVFDCI